MYSTRSLSNLSRTTGASNPLTGPIIVEGIPAIAKELKEYGIERERQQNERERIRANERVFTMQFELTHKELMHSITEKEITRRHLYTHVGHYLMICAENKDTEGAISALNTLMTIYQEGVSQSYKELSALDNMASGRNNLFLY